jgi:hypothetical protein
MSVIAERIWLDYTRASVKGRPTVTVYLPAIETNVAQPSIAAKDPRLMATHLLIDKIAALPENWDSQGSATPDPLAVHRARQLAQDAFLAASATLGWQSPYVSASEDGHIVFEWWNGGRKLTVYVGPKHSTYLKSWGPHVVDDMEDGELEENWDAVLWAWLFG